MSKKKKKKLNRTQQCKFPTYLREQPVADFSEHNNAQNGIKNPAPLLNKKRRSNPVLPLFPNEKKFVHAQISSLFTISIIIIRRRGVAAVLNPTKATSLPPTIHIYIVHILRRRTREALYIHKTEARKFPQPYKSLTGALKISGISPRGAPAAAASHPSHFSLPVLQSCARPSLSLTDHRTPFSHPRSRPRVDRSLPPLHIFGRSLFHTHRPKSQRRKGIHIYRTSGALQERTPLLRANILTPLIYIRTIHVYRVSRLIVWMGYYI